MIAGIISPLGHGNTGLVCSGVNLTSWGEGASLAFVGDAVKIPYGLDVSLL